MTANDMADEKECTEQPAEIMSRANGSEDNGSKPGETLLNTSTETGPKRRRYY